MTRCTGVQGAGVLGRSLCYLLSFCLKWNREPVSQCWMDCTWHSLGQSFLFKVVARNLRRIMKPDAIHVSGLFEVIAFERLAVIRRNIEISLREQYEAFRACDARVGCLWHHFSSVSQVNLFLPHHAHRSPAKHIASASTMAESVHSAPVMSSTSSSSVPVPAKQSTAEKPHQTQTLPIRDSKDANTTNSDIAPPKGKDTTTSGPAVGGDGAGDKSLTPAELKKKAKAEKTARRAKEKLEREGPAPAVGGPAAAGAGGSQVRPSATFKKDGAPGGSQKGQKAPPPRRGSVAVAQTGAKEQQKKKKEDKSVAVFGHLYGQQRRTTIAGAGKEVHPAVLALGLQMRDYVVCGSSARCVATLLAFKRVSLFPIHYCFYCLLTIYR